MGLFSFFSSSSHPQQANTSTMGQILSYTKSIIVRQDLLTHILLPQDVENMSNLEYIKQALQTYFSLEDIIIHNKPLVVQKEYTKQSLRDEIRTKFPIASLPQTIGIIYLPEKEQRFFLFWGYTQMMIDYLINQVGPERLKSQLYSLSAHTPFGTLDISSSTGQTQALSLFSNFSKEAAIQAFRELHTELFQYISSSFGEKTAEELTKRHYQIIKDLYEYDFIAQYLQVIPSGQLEKEKVAYLTREDLERRAIAAAEDKFQREIAEQSAKNLQQEKMTIELKVKEQTAELKKEKEALQQAITKMNQNFLQAKRNEAKLLASVSSLSLGFILLDTNNHIVTINIAAKKIFGFPRELTQLSEIAFLLSTSCNLLSLVQASQSTSETKELKLVEWKNYFLRITVSPIFLTDPVKEYIGSAILISDITEEKRLEQTKDDFFAIASHELRTPLTAIRGSISILKSYYTEKMSDGDIPKLIQYIEQSSVRLIDIVNDFLNVSRLEQGRMVFKPEALSIDELINNAISELSSLAQQKNISLTYLPADASLPQVHGDRQKIKQVLVNLVGNSIKFTNTGGITITAKQHQSMMEIRVQDTGSGIASENHGLLFRKFQQADQNLYTHDATKGTGLGLYISKKLVENMGGTILLESSEVGKGSTFLFTLPIETVSTSP